MDTIILDDGIEYAIIKEEKINNIVYTLFTNIENQEDICYRKTIIDEDGDECYVGLDNEKEFDLVAMHFAKIFLEENR